MTLSERPFLSIFSEELFPEIMYERSMWSPFLRSVMADFLAVFGNRRADASAMVDEQRESLARRFAAAEAGFVFACSGAELEITLTTLVDFDNFFAFRFLTFDIALSVCFTFSTLAVGLA